METSWPAITTETLPWKLDSETRDLIPKSRRRKIGNTYEAAVPAKIATASLALPQDLTEHIAELMAAMARFDARQEARGYNLSAMLLRSESAASSQIENLTSSARNVALAELSSKAPNNAQLIVGNLQAMRRAFATEGEITCESILEIHATLMNRSGVTFGGSLRTEQVWVGGSGYSPHGALFVPPSFKRVPELMDDLVVFAHRDDVQPIAKAAILHAQMETIHPFIDGNGRTGRTLIHKVLTDEEVLRQAALPISAGLLHNVDAYMNSITEYQEGNPIPFIEQLIEALELAIIVGVRTAHKMDDVIDNWTSQITERKGSKIHRLPQLLVEQPVVDSALLAKELDITQRAAMSLIARACEYGMLRPIGNRQRGEFYQADRIIDVLEEISDIQGIRCILSA